MALTEVQAVFLLVVLGLLLFAGYTAIFGYVGTLVAETRYERQYLLVDLVGTFVVGLISFAMLWLAILMVVNAERIVPVVAPGLLGGGGLPPTLGGVPTWYGIALGVLTSLVASGSGWRVPSLLRRLW